jgi:hypothetical protein
VQWPEAERICPRGARHEVVGAAANVAAVEEPEEINRLIAGFLLD